ncbi:MAG TPA: YIP1 family protein [Ktedonobacteraceae bacterium]|nr:YIP1 family protein [Ktedonobacteraceae bacterium]
MSEYAHQAPQPDEQPAPEQEQEHGSPAPAAPVSESFGVFPDEAVESLPTAATPAAESQQPGETPAAPESPLAYTSPQFYDQPRFANPSPVVNPPAAAAPLPGYLPPPGYMPPPGYALPPGSMLPPGYVAVPIGAVLPTTPLPLGKALRQLPRQYWHVLTHPKASTFAAEQGKAAWNIILLQLLFQSIIQAIMILILFFIESFMLPAFFPSDMVAEVSSVLPLAAGVTALLVLVGVPMAFFIGAGICHLLARASGGQGNFLAYCYNYALITVPLGLLIAVGSVIPCLGNLILLGGSLYEVILLIYMTMGTHRLSGGKASAAVLTPVIIVTVLVIGLYAVSVVWTFSTLQAL